MSPNSQVHEDWTFSVTNIYGPSRLLVTLPPGWLLSRVLHGDRDITDNALNLMSGEELTDVDVLVTNRVTTMSGRVTDQKGGAIADATVVVFGVQSEKWFDRSRWVRAVRPNRQGLFRIDGLPPGEYFAVALDYLQDLVWNDPEMLASLTNGARKIILDQGESELVTLAITLTSR